MGNTLQPTNFYRAIAHERNISHRRLKPKMFHLLALKPCSFDAKANCNYSGLNFSEISRVMSKDRVGFEG